MNIVTKMMTTRVGIRKYSYVRNFEEQNHSKRVLGTRIGADCMLVNSQYLTVILFLWKFVDHQKVQQDPSEMIHQFMLLLE